MILNGVDLVDITRFEKFKRNKNFMNSIFNENELLYIKKHSNNNATIAGLYAAKESFLKCLGKGINSYPLKDIEVIHDDNGAPLIILHNNLNLDYNFKNISLSISHDGNYAIAIVLVII